MATLADALVGVFIPLIAGIVASFCIEQLLHPRPLLRARPVKAIAMHIAIWLLFYGLGLAIWQRPYFASGLNTAGILLLVLVSNAKFASLREPFLLSDFRFFTALLRHPRLYLPFFGVLPMIGCALAFIAFCGFALWIEPSMISKVGLAAFLYCCLIVSGFGAALLGFAMRNPTPISLAPARDVQTFGLLGSLLRYWQEERANDPRAMIANLRGALQRPANIANCRELPHVVAVQCESFFDARRVFAGVSPDVLKNYDALTRISSRAGRLNVPAWGANTVRTEFSFLTGIPPASLGIHQFNPYRKFARAGVPTVASELKKRGYRTLCIHPFASTFYDRDKVFPALGFDEFIDISAFAPEDKSGPYTGDLAVAAKVSAVLSAATEPLFIFVITMENHGPLHQEQVADGDIERLYASLPPAGYEDFTIYLRHLAHTDAMLGQLHEALNATSRRGWLCAYGDHVPILPGVYAANDFVDGRTDYLVVGPGEHTAPRSLDIAPEDLVGCLLGEAGL